MIDKTLSESFTEIRLNKQSDMWSINSNSDGQNQQAKSMEDSKYQQDISDGNNSKALKGDQSFQSDEKNTSFSDLKDIYGSKDYYDYYTRLQP